MDRDALTRLGGAPNRIRLATLKHHMVLEDAGGNDLGPQRASAKNKENWFGELHEKSLAS
jgi:hypothetical protein